MSGFKKSVRAKADSSSKDEMADGVASFGEVSDDNGTLEPAKAADVDFIDSLNIDDMRKMSKDEKKALFFKSGGKMRLDTKAIYDMRERNMV